MSAAHWHSLPVPEVVGIAMSGFGMEEDVKRVISYLNEHVVPEVRENSSKALRVAAEQLTKLAEHLDRRQGR